MKELIKNFREVENYIISLCDDEIQRVNLNVNNGTWQIVNIGKENQLFQDITDLINFLHHKNGKKSLTELCLLYDVVVPKGTLFCKCLVPEQKETFNAPKNTCRCGGKISK